MRVRKGDLVQIISGKDRGKQGRVLTAEPTRKRLIVENLNIVKRHRRPKPIRDSSRMGGQQVQPGGIIELAAPVDISNVMVVCPSCNRPTRVGYTLREQKGEQVKLRVCKRVDCGEVLDR